MSEAECTCYHMGHGAMYCVTVYEDSKKKFIKKRFLIDAGSNQDCSIDGNRFADTNVDKIIDIIDASSDEEWIFCLTHLHKDHYSAFQTISERVSDIERKVQIFFIGSLTEDEWQNITEAALKSFDEYTAGKQALQNMLDKFGDKVIFLNHRTEAIDLWSDGNVSLYLLFNCMFNLDTLEDAKQTLNSNCASFLVKQKSHQSAFWFTGDVTGETLDNIVRGHKKTMNKMKAILKDCIDVVITPPHHGSIHSLMMKGFAQVKIDKKSEDWSSTNWVDFCDKIGLIRSGSGLICRLAWSSCLYDKYQHPDGVALAIYSDVCRMAQSNYEWAVYRTYSSEPPNLFHESFRVEDYSSETKIDYNNWWLQNLKRQIYTTLQFLPTKKIDTRNLEYGF